MTIAKQVRMPTSVLEEAKRFAEFYGISTNRILSDAILRGLITYEFVGYRRIKNNREILKLIQQLRAMDHFLAEAIRSIDMISDSTEKERERQGELPFDIPDGPMPSFTPDDDQELDDLIASMNCGDGDALLDDLLESSADADAELDDLLRVLEH